jgi:hypothetical protein
MVESGAETCSGDSIGNFSGAVGRSWGGVPVEVPDGICSKIGPDAAQDAAG